MVTFSVIFFLFVIYCMADWNINWWENSWEAARDIRWKSHHHSCWQHCNVFCWLFSSFNIYFIFQQWIKGCLTLMLERMKHCKNTIEEGGRMVWTMWPISIAMVVTVLMWIVTQGSTTYQPRTSHMRRTKEDFRRALNNEQPAGEILDRVPAWIEKSDGRTNP